MAEHNLFYYPYASFSGAQLPLLKVAALYFDKLYILDPEKATGGSIGPGDVAGDIALLEQKQILVRVSPEEILEKYESEIAAAIHADMEDREFLELCERSGKAETWRLALAKVPKEIRENVRHGDYARQKPQDQAMQRLMGDLPRAVAGQDLRYVERYVEVTQQLSSGDFVYDESQQSGNREIEYRYADYPLPLGEAIMMNHALFASLLHAEATPITDDPFHNEALSVKLRRAVQDPAVQEARKERAQQSRVDLLAVETLTDAQLSLPVLDPSLPLKEILEYRQAHDAELGQARDKLGWMARRIREEPWSKEFAEQLNRETIPDINEELNNARRTRDEWLKNRGRLAVSATGIVVGAAAAVLAVVAAPLTPIALATGGLAVAGATIPGFGWLKDWREGKKSLHENGLHYLLQV